MIKVDIIAASLIITMISAFGVWVRYMFSKQEERLNDHDARLRQSIDEQTLRNILNDAMQKNEAEIKHIKESQQRIEAALENVRNNTNTANK